jgi:hypothetical protein
LIADVIRVKMLLRTTALSQWASEGNPDICTELQPVPPSLAASHLGNPETYYLKGHMTEEWLNLCLEKDRRNSGAQFYRS